MKYIFSTIFLFTFSANIWAQETRKLGVTLEIRPRSEFRNGAFTLRMAEDDPAFFISQRSRLSLDYSLEELTLGFSVQNVRVWGESSQIAPDEGNNTMINEAWAAYQLTEDLAVKFGRQALIYDDDRILGSLDWHQAGRWHDALLLKYDNDIWQVDVGAGYNQDAENILGNEYLAPGNNYKSMQMLWAGRPIGEIHKFSLLVLNTGFEDPIDSKQNFMQTFGLNFYQVDEPLNLTGTFYYQSGENAAGLEAKSFLAAVYGSLSLSENFALLAGTDFLTGNNMNSTENGVTNAFNPLYGTHHKFYGYMDYFYVGVPHSNVGLWDKYGGFKTSFSENFSIQLMAHAFNSAGDIYDMAANENLSSYLGTELDLTFNWSLSEAFKINGGYSQMLATESMEIIKGRGDQEKLQNWAWLMLTAKPRLY